MADKKISQLTSLAQGDIATTTDVLAIVDTSATETKKATPAAIVGAAAAAGLTSVDINSGAIDGTTIGANSAAAGTFTNLTASGTVSFSGATVSNGGSVTTVDINGGTIDGATIATSDITVGSGKTLNVSAGTLTLADNQISGDKVEGGTINAITINTLTSTTVNTTTVDATNVEVTNIKAKDGTAAASIADSTGIVSLSANPILSGGTANGVLYLNGSKVATSGSAFVFDGTNVGIGTASPQTILNGFSASARGMAIETAYPLIAFSDTSNASYKFYFGTDSGEAYLWNNFDGPIRFAVNNAEQMRLTSTGLGIGTTSPAGKLHVVGDNLANTFKLIANTTVSGSDATIFRPADNTMAFSTNGLERLRIDSAGNLGIGTTSPAYKLDVVGGNILRGTSSGVSAALYISGSTPAFGTTTNNVLTFITNDTERLRLDTSGNLGLGVTPSAFSTGKAMQIGALNGITLFGFAGGAEFGSNFNFDSSYKYTTTGAAARYTTGGGTHAWYTAPSGTAGNAITFTQAMTLDASGNLGVGTTSPATRLEVAGASPILRLTDTTNSVTGGVYAALEWKTSDASASGGIVSKIDCIDDLGLYGDRGALRFFTHNSSSLGERARITAAGELLVGKTTTTANGGVVQVSNGVTFPATQVACSDANTLDDYEEGAWTPTYVPTTGAFTSVTYDSATLGRYTKIGNTVFCTGTLRTDAITVGTASGGLLIGGLPFTVNAAGPQGVVSVGYVDAFAGDAPFGGTVSVSTTTAFIWYRTTSNGGSTQLDVTDLGTGANSNFMTFNIIYTV